MGRKSTGDTGWRGSRELWLGAAYDSLLEAGVDAVRIQPLGERLKLSRTSFYWFFRDREDLLNELLGLWTRKNIDNLILQAEAYAESIAETILNVFDCWLDQHLFDSKLEYAVRSWALQSPEVAAEAARADERRIAALAAAFLRHGFDAVAADVRGRAIFLTQIGYISLRTREEIGVRMARIPEYVATFTGTRPTASEISRFHARHGFAFPVADLPDSAPSAGRPPARTAKPPDRGRPAKTTRTPAAGRQAGRIHSVEQDAHVKDSSQHAVKLVEDPKEAASELQ